YFLTDEDVIASQAQEFAPFPGLSDTYNGITATYPEPASLWEAKDAPPRFDAGWEAEDGGRRLVANISLPACPHGTQVQRLMTSAIADHRRMRSHRLVLPPEAAVLEPLETVGWTSTRWGYAAKTFEITSLTDSLMSMLQGLSLRERDAADYDWTPGDEIGVELPATSVSPPAAQTVPGFVVAAIVLEDSAAADRRPAIELIWDADAADDATGLQWEVRHAGATDVQTVGTFSMVREGRLILSGSILPDESYEVRGRLIVDRATDWTDWEAVTTDDIRLGRVDVNGALVQAGVVGPVTMSGGAHVQCTLAWGPTGASSIWLRGVTFRARKITGALSSVTLKLQRRTKEAGTWSAWIDRNTWDITSSAWDQYTSSATVVGNYEDVEERLLSDCSDTQTNALSNITMIATDIIK
ncbi:phage tail protein, partial [Tabrizicola fusiformis]|uniref:phage tail protein n=1 Tax=Tabrizicola sp. SY72 TaxID=2741673 RepID=UPI001F504494